MLRQIKILQRFIFCLSLLLCCSSLSFSQTDQLLVELADEMYEFGDYEDALGIYQQAIAENPENVRAQFQIGNCFLKTNWGKEQSVQYFKQAYELDPEISAQILYLIGQGFRFSYEFDKAIEYYLLYEEFLRTDRRAAEAGGLNVDQELKRLKRRIYECENGKEFKRRPQDLKITNMGPAINSEYDDYAPNLNYDENVVIFTSRREGTGGLKDRDNKYYEDLWIASGDGNGNWEAPTNLGENVNTITHESNIALSADGDRLYMYKTENGGDIFVSEMKKGVWKKPESIGRPINTEFMETSVYLTDDEDRIFFSSNRPGGAGGLDLYYCDRDEKGKWGEPVRLPDGINSEYDDEGPFFDSYGQTLYFSSKGHKGMGGFDVFKSKYNESTEEWTKPENMGFPINSTDDDLFYSQSSDGLRGYYSSHKEDSHGGTDLYLITPLDAPFIEEDTTSTVDTNTIAGIDTSTVEVEKQPVKLVIEVIDFTTRKPVLANVEIVHKTSGSLIEGGKAVGGTFQTTFNNNEDIEYIVLIEANGYLFQSDKVAIPEMTTEESTVIRSFSMRPQEINVPNVLRNIYFGFDKYHITMQATAELDKLKKMMEANNNMTIEIAGHTDFVGTDGYNQHLSQMRANSVKEYLTKAGISSDRVQSKGYGEKYPIASNDDEEEGRELNRRTEFIILTQ